MAALVAMAALSLLTGWLLSRLVLGRIDAISADAGAIVAAAGPGTLDRRIARTGSGDEFDRLADTLNAMLDRIGLLVRDLRSLTDGLAHERRAFLEALASDDAAEGMSAFAQKRRPVFGSR